MKTLLSGTAIAAAFTFLIFRIARPFRRPTPETFLGHHLKQINRRPKLK